MRSLFWKIFLWFWLSMTVLIAATAMLTWSMRPTTPRFANEPDAAPGGRRYLPAAETLAMLARLSATAYRRGGASAIPSQWARRGSARQVETWLLAADGRILAHTDAPPPRKNVRARNSSGVASTDVASTDVAPAELRALAQRALSNARLQTAAHGDQFLAATSTRFDDGQRFVFVASARIPPRFNALPELPTRRIFPLFGPLLGPGEPLQRAIRFGAMLLIAGVFCFVLARHLTRPVTQLRTATRQLERGQLSARVAANLGNRRDELGDLGRDFNAMAARLETLMNAQRRLIGDVSHELRSPLARLEIALELARRHTQIIAPHSASSGKSSTRIVPSSNEIIARLESSDRAQVAIMEDDYAQSAVVALETAHNRIGRETARLEEIVGQLLMLSRLESGAPDEENSEFDAEILVREVAADVRFEAHAQNRDIEIRRQIDAPDSADSRTPVGKSSLLSARNNTLRRSFSTRAKTEIPLEILNAKSSDTHNFFAEFPHTQNENIENQSVKSERTKDENTDSESTKNGRATHAYAASGSEASTSEANKNATDGRTISENLADEKRRAISKNNGAASESPFVLRGSRTLLRGALENVLRNAVRFAPPQSNIEIAIGREITAAGAAKIVIRVLDRGPGVPFEALPKLFEPFYRAEEARDRQSGGTGLGLAIAERAVKRHGGTIRAFNRDRDGAVLRENFDSSHVKVGGFCVEIVLPQTSSTH